MRDAEGVADVMEGVVVDVPECLLSGVQGLDQCCRSIAYATHPGLDDLPALVVARGGWLGVQDGHVPSLQTKKQVAFCRRDLTDGLRDGTKPDRPYRGPLFPTLGAVSPLSLT